VATIIHKKIEGHGPYAYRVRYENGTHHWEYLGKVDNSSEDEQDLTNDDEQDRGEMKDADDFDVETETLIAADQTDVDMDEVISQLEEGDLIRHNGKTYTVSGFDDNGFGPTSIKTEQNGDIGVIEGIAERGETLEKVDEEYDPSWEHHAVRLHQSDPEKNTHLSLSEGAKSNLSVTEFKDADRNTVLVESPHEAKDDIKALEDDGYDPSWNGSQWEVSAEAVPDLVERLHESDAPKTGYVEVSADILVESGAADELSDAREMLDEIDD